MDKLLIVDGYEMTGKTHYINKLLDTNYNYVLLKNNYELFNDRILPYKYRGIIGLSKLSTLNDISTSHTSSNLLNLTFILDRSIASTYVYNEYYNQGISEVDMANLVRIFKDMTINYEVEYIHKCHKDIESAKYLYNKSLSDNCHNDDYDRSYNFYEYYSKYKKFEELFKFFYDKYNFDIIYKSSLE